VEEDADNHDMNREPREICERPGVFACFGCFAVCPAFHIGAVIEVPYFMRSSFDES